MHVRRQVVVVVVVVVMVVVVGGSFPFSQPPANALNLQTTARYRP